MDSLPFELISRIMVDVVSLRPNRLHDTWCSPRTLGDVDEPSDYWTEFRLPIRRTRPQTHGPLQLGLVSSLWKDISENTPALWNRIAVDIDSMNDHNLPTTMCELSRRLSRSGTLPLNIRVAYHEISRSAMLRGVTRLVLDELHLHSGRFRSVSFLLNSEILESSRYYHNSSPILTHFHLSNEDGALGLEDHELKTSWPSLTHLTLKFIPFGSLSISHSNLTYLKLVCVEVPFPWTTIQAAELLIYLIMDRCYCVGGFGSLAGREASVTLRSLKHFEYNPIFYPLEGDLLQVFVMPSLTHLIVREDSSRPGYQIDALASHPFLATCASSLRHLVLIGKERDHRDPPYCHTLVDTLAPLSSLEILELSLANVPRSYFSPLLIRLTTTPGTEAGDPTFLSRLRTLQFNSIHGLLWPLIPGIFHQTESLDQRPLRQLIIKNMLPVNAESLTINVIDQINDLLDNGIDIQLYDEEGERIKRRGVDEIP